MTFLLKVNGIRTIKRDKQQTMEPLNLNSLTRQEDFSIRSDEKRGRIRGGIRRITFEKCATNKNIH